MARRREDKQTAAQSSELQLLGLLPRVLRVTEVTVRRSLKVLRLLETERLDNETRAEVEVLANDLDQLLVGLLAGTVCIDEDGEGLSNTDGVGELDESTAGETTSDQGLGDPAGSVSRGTVDLGEVLAREGSSTVGTPATVGVDNDLTTSQTSVTLGTTNDEAARGLNLDT